MRYFRALRRYRRLLWRYLRPLWRELLLLTFIMLATIIAQVTIPLLGSRFIDNATSGGSLQELSWLAIAVLLVALAQQGIAVAETYLAEKISWQATNALRGDLLAHLLRLDATFHTAHTPGELIERVDGDVSTLSRFFSRFVVNVLGNAALLCAVVVLLLHIDWRVGLGLGAFVLLALLAMLRIRSAATPSWAAERQASAEYYGFLGEYLGGLEDIHSSAAGSYVLWRSTALMRLWLAITLRAQMLGYLLVATSQGLFALGTVLALGLSAMLFTSGALTIGTAYLIFQYNQMLSQPTEQIRNEIQDFQLADASLGRIESLLSVAPRLSDGPIEQLPAGSLALDFDSVSFGYTAETLTLRQISLHLEPGHVLGVVGRTGSGKSTLARLLARFYDPQAGTVRVGGIDLREVALAAIRSRVALVTQEIHLFAASLRHNLTLFDDTIRDDHLHQALEAVGLTDWFSSLPQGLDTQLQPGMVGLSAGQEQLLSCARVLLRDPDIVILDEATSRLDPATARQVQPVLDQLLKGRTGIVVAHRLASVRTVDEILVLEDGQMREHGPRQLLAADPDSAFAALLRLDESEVTR